MNGFHRAGRRHHARRVHGFSLLEAIVALAILAALGLVLFDWIRQSLDSASRIRAEHLRVQALINAQSLVASINPGAEPEGERSVAGLTVRWTSRMIAGPQALFGEVLRPDEAPEGWQIALYELTVQGTYPAGEGDPAGRLPLSFQAVRAGAMPAPVARPVSR